MVLVFPRESYASRTNDHSQKNVNGIVKLKIYKGNVILLVENQTQFVFN